MDRKFILREVSQDVLTPKCINHNGMKIFLVVVSIIGLILTIVPSVLVFTGHLSRESQKQLMLYGMILWFGAAPFWIKEQKL